MTPNCAAVALAGVLAALLVAACDRNRACSSDGECTGGLCLFDGPTATSGRCRDAACDPPAHDAGDGRCVRSGCADGFFIDGDKCTQELGTSCLDRLACRDLSLTCVVEIDAGVAVAATCEKDCREGTRRVGDLCLEDNECLAPLRPTNTGACVDYASFECDGEGSCVPGHVCVLQPVGPRCVESASPCPPGFHGGGLSNCVPLAECESGAVLLEDGACARWAETGPLAVDPLATQRFPSFYEGVDGSFYYTGNRLTGDQWTEAEDPFGFPQRFGRYSFNISYINNNCTVRRFDHISGEVFTRATETTIQRSFFEPLDVRHDSLQLVEIAGELGFFAYIAIEPSEGTFADDPAWFHLDRDTLAVHEIHRGPVPVHVPTHDAWAVVHGDEYSFVTSLRPFTIEARGRLPLAPDETAFLIANQELFGAIIESSAATDDCPACRDEKSYLIESDTNGSFTRIDLPTDDRRRLASIGQSTFLFSTIDNLIRAHFFSLNTDGFTDIPSDTRISAVLPNVDGSYWLLGDFGHPPATEFPVSQIRPGALSPWSLGSLPFSTSGHFSQTSQGLIVCGRPADRFPAVDDACFQLLIDPR